MLQPLRLKCLPGFFTADSVHWNLLMQPAWHMVTKSTWSLYNFHMIDSILLFTDESNHICFLLAFIDVKWLNPFIFLIGISNMEMWREKSDMTGFSDTVWVLGLRVFHNCATSHAIKPKAFVEKLYFYTVTPLVGKRRVNRVTFQPNAITVIERFLLP